MIRIRHGVIVGLLVGALVGGTAGATILTAASSHPETTASVPSPQRDVR